MPATSITGAPAAALSTLMLAAGGPQASSFQVQWTGPFNPGETTFLGAWQWQSVSSGLPVTVTLAQLQPLSLSDPGWWVITG